MNSSSVVGLDEEKEEEDVVAVADPLCSAPLLDAAAIFSSSVFPTGSTSASDRAREPDRELVLRRSTKTTSYLRRLRSLPITT